MAVSPSYLFKIVTVGSSAVGKTSIILRYVTGRFREHYTPTLGTDFSIKMLRIGSTKVKLQIWDMGSQDFLGNVRARFYQGARGVIFMYDVTRRSTLNDLIVWKREVDKHISDYTSIILANKIDLVEEREVSELEGIAFANNLGGKHLETSVKNNENVSDAFQIIAEDIMASQNL